jgi:hypothetical protein
MEKYLNKSGGSGVNAFEIGDDYINIIFIGSSSVYTYNFIKPGKRMVDVMKQLARTGSGLSTYISREVKENYFSKKG